MQNGTFSLQLGKDNGASPSSMNASRAIDRSIARAHGSIPLTALHHLATTRPPASFAVSKSIGACLFVSIAVSRAWTQRCAQN